MIVAQDFVASFFLFHNEQDNINALAVAMSFNFVFALITLFKLRFTLNILFNCYCIKMLMLKVFAQQMLWHFRSYGRTFKITVLRRSCKGDAQRVHIHRTRPPLTPGAAN